MRAPSLGRTAPSALRMQGRELWPITYAASRKNVMRREVKIGCVKSGNEDDEACCRPVYDAVSLLRAYEAYLIVTPMPPSYVVYLLNLQQLHESQQRGNRRRRTFVMAERTVPPSAAGWRALTNTRRCKPGRRIGVRGSWQVIHTVAGCPRNAICINPRNDRNFNS